MLFAKLLRILEEIEKFNVQPLFILSFLTLLLELICISESFAAVVVQVIELIRYFQIELQVVRCFAVQSHRIAQIDMYEYYKILVAWMKENVSNLTVGNVDLHTLNTFESHSVLHRLQRANRFLTLD